MIESTPIKIEFSARRPEDLISTAIHLTGLAEVLYQALDRAHEGDGIEGAENISWGYAALADLAQRLADEISDH